MRAVVGAVHHERIVGKAQSIEGVKNRADVLVVVDHHVGVFAHPSPGLAAALRLGVGPEMHVGEVYPEEERFAGLVLPLDEVDGPGRDVVVDRLHPLFRERAGVDDGLPALAVGHAIEHAARSEPLAELGVLGVVR